MKSSDLYEKYHSGDKPQKKIIDDKNFTYREIIPYLNKYFTGKKIIDIGCGTGTLDFYLASKGSNVTGIDLSNKAIKTALENSRILGFQDKTKFLLSEFPNISIDEKYDGLICTEVLEHLPDDRVGAQKAFDLLKPGGMALFSSPSNNSPLFRFGLTKKHDKNAGHLRRYSIEEFKALIEKAGFKIEKTKKTQGIFREAIFIFPFLNIFVKSANRFKLFSDLFTFIDKLLLPFGESDIIILATKK